MIYQKLRKTGNSFVVTIPRDEIDRLGLKEGQIVGLQVTPMELRPMMRPAIRTAFERGWSKSEAAYQWLVEEEERAKS